MLCDKNDPLIPPGNAEQLAALLREASAEVDYQAIPSGHGLTQADIEVARRWLAGYSSLL
jgi:phospholipase/carboxylesterase